MQSYFSLIKGLKPTMTTEAHTILQRYYVYHRQKETRNASRTTVRMLDSVIRLSEGDAVSIGSNVRVTELLQYKIMKSCCLF